MTLELKGQFFSAGEGVRIYLLGNPIIWWSNLFFMGFYLTLFVVKCVRDRRGVVASERQTGAHFKKPFKLPERNGAFFRTKININLFLLVCPQCYKIGCFTRVGGFTSDGYCTMSRFGVWVVFCTSTTTSQPCCFLACYQVI